VDLLSSVGAGEDLVEVTTRGMQHLWEPMVGIPTPPERGCGGLSYVGIGFSYDGHREDSHPMCEGSWNIHAHDMHDHSIYDLSFSIFLGLKGHGFGELGFQK
jgi:hypothetical protein